MMTVLNKIFSITFIVMLVCIMIGYRSCSNLKQELKDSESAYNNLTMKFDSILSMPPDTIVKPPVIIKKDSLIYVTKWISKPSSDAKTYRDSIINDSIDIRLEIVAKELFKVDYQYKPIFRYQEKIIEKKIPYAVQVIKEVKVPQQGLFFQAGLGMGDDVGAKIGLTFLTKKKTFFSYDFVMTGNNKTHFVSYGVKF